MNLKLIQGIAVTTFVTAVLSFLIRYYVNINLLYSIYISFVYCLLIAISFYFYQKVSGFLKPMQAKVAVWALSHTLVILIIIALFRIDLTLLPIMVVFSTLCWIIAAMRITMMQINDSHQTSGDNDGELPSKAEPIDKISVKEGSHIHIIELDHLEYIQSYGDYIMLFTDKGKYLKEQTMKYMEASLPSPFVRIHRSYIVNSNKIARVELFGKESYNIYLKKGTCIKASASGYKLLKEHLNL